MNATATDVIIMNNEGSNLYLTDNGNFVITLVALTEGSRVGVTAMLNPWFISTENDTDYSSLFSADSDDCHVGYAYNRLALTSEFNKFTVSYDLNGGEGAVAAGICKTFTSEGSVQITSALPTRVCHEFLGWAESAEAAEAAYTAGETLNLTGDKTLYAVWSVSHDLTKVDKVEPDCTHEGKEEYRSCACGKYFEDASATKEIADISTWGILSVRHTFTEWDAEVPATCASEGVKAHKDCEICHKHFDAEGNEIADLTIAKITSDGEEPDEPAKGGCGSVAFGGARAVAGIGVFSVVWFVIRKKKTADSAATFKKK